MFFSAVFFLTSSLARLNERGVGRKTMKNDDEMRPSDLLSKETLRKADEMYESLASRLAIDKRGEASFHAGAFTDLDSLARRQYPVTVVDIDDHPWFTLISEVELPATDNGLLVYQVPPREQRRYLGRTQPSKGGRRTNDPPDRLFTLFDILRDARHR